MGKTIKVEDYEWYEVTCTHKLTFNKFVLLRLIATSKESALKKATDKVYNDLSTKDRLLYKVFIRLDAEVMPQHRLLNIDLNCPTELAKFARPNSTEQFNTFLA